DAVVWQLSLPAMPAVKVVNSLPVPFVQAFQLEEEFVSAGMKAPAALKCCGIIFGHDYASFFNEGFVICRSRDCRLAGQCRLAGTGNGAAGDADLRGGGPWPTPSTDRRDRARRRACRGSREIPAATESDAALTQISRRTGPDAGGRRQAKESVRFRCTRGRP